MFYFLFYNFSLLDTGTKVKLPPIKKLYVLYSLLRNFKTSKKILFNPFNFYVCLYYSLITTNRSLRSLFFSLLFFSKTFDVSFVSRSTNNIFMGRFNLFSTGSLGNITITNLNVFWKKWKNLRRPVTDSSFDLFYLDEFKKKLQVYSNIGFIKTYNTYVILRARTELLNNVVVSFSRSLLTLPKYSSSSINKYLSLGTVSAFEFQFLRKNKVYNKGRYSRTRQNYRTGVYMCMYLSVISIFGLYYWFYRFSFNFTYIWWFFISFVASFFLPKIFKYRLYEPNTLLTKVFDLFRWCFLLVKSFFF